METQLLSWIEFQRLLDKLETNGVKTGIIGIRRKKLTEPEDHDFQVRTGLRYKDYSILTATVYSKEM